MTGTTAGDPWAPQGFPPSPWPGSRTCWKVGDEGQEEVAEGEQGMQVRLLEQRAGYITHKQVKPPPGVNLVSLITCMKYDA